ncbi:MULTISPECIES: LysR family transcriptional regulator [Pseudonocardia]|uniref:LysR family transcriptional regulator n=1 Tax=Pseudonocardia abyssalis TaxID=2792008 RepID=A0ABS6V0F8_9PSEU|nr:LysR family transcriptional regulator [Pseudonocardia abyssalis]MBW0118938.1 LysR family transcriptional regulator [Pseudonocardia abyssalis]MBW0137980.1 LysR family transcriptional regulator [Pseudonocardia abyssalis]
MPLPPRVPDIGALDLLLSVARLGSLGRAAQAHGISQPAAGSRIRHLEGLLGLSLIDRSALGSALTADGAAVVGWARDVVDAAVALDGGVESLRSGHTRQLQVAASLTVAEYLVPSWLTGLRARRPDAVVSVRVVNSAQVAEQVLTGGVGVGFVEGPSTPAGLESCPVGHDRLVLVVAREHPWTRCGRPVEVAELAGTPLVQREPGSGTRETTELLLHGLPDVAAPSVELSSTTAIKAAVAAGVGPAVLSSLAVAEELRHGQLVAVPVIGAALDRTLRAVWATGRTLGPESRDVLAVATAHSAARPDPGG